MTFRLLTLLIVLALAATAWYLSSPRLRPGALDAARRGAVPGYFLNDGVLTEYDTAGNPTVRIAAKRIEQVAQGNDVELHDVRVDYQSPEGATWFMVGSVAHVQPGGAVVDIAGNVELQGTDPRRSVTPVIRADTLSYDVKRTVVSTSGDVRIDFAPHTLTARGLVANLREHTVRLESRINGRFQP